MQVLFRGSGTAPGGAASANRGQEGGCAQAGGHRDNGMALLHYCPGQMSQLSPTALRHQLGAPDPGGEAFPEPEQEEKRQIRLSQSLTAGAQKCSGLKENLTVFSFFFL